MVKTTLKGTFPILGIFASKNKVKINKKDGGGKTPTGYNKTYKFKKNEKDDKQKRNRLQKVNRRLFKYH